MCCSGQRHEEYRMEFMILSNDLVDALGSECLLDIVASAAMQGDATYTMRRARSFSLISCDPVGSSLVVFDGHLFYDHLYHPRYRAPSLSSARSVLSDIAHISGGFVVGVVDIAANQFEISTDALGQYTLYHASRVGEGAFAFAISNNPYVLETLLAVCGVSGSRSALNVALNLSYLSSLASVSPFGSIVSSAGCVRFKFDSDFSISRLPRTRLYVAPQTYDAAIREAAAEIRRNCALIGAFSQEFNVHTIIDLSGGVDSRMVLAGFLAASAEKDVKFFNANNVVDGSSADRVVADLIMDHFGLASGTSISESRTASTTLNSAKRFSVGGKPAFGCGHYFGHLPYAYADYGELYLDGYARAGGYCGEHARAPGPNLLQLVNGGATSAGFAKKYVGFARANAAHTSTEFVTDDALHETEAAFRSYFDELQGELPPILTNTACYVENRSKFHFGMRTRNANASSVSLAPLATPALLKAHQAGLSYSEMFNRKIAYDLICELAGPELAHLPLADDFWRENAVQPDRRDASNSVQPARRSAVHNGRSGSLDAFSLRTSDSPFAETEYDEWRKQTSFPDHRDALVRYLLEAIPASDPLWNYVSRTSVECATGVSGGHGPNHVVKISRLCAMLLFGAKKTRVSRLMQHVDAPEAIRQRQTAYAKAP
jgi:hypothetical protein